MVATNNIDAHPTMESTSQVNNLPAAPAAAVISEQPVSVYLVHFLDSRRWRRWVDGDQNPVERTPARHLGHSPFILPTESLDTPMPPCLSHISCAFTNISLRQPRRIANSQKN